VVLSLSLLLDIVLDTTLTGLALGTELVVVSLLLLVAGEVGDGASDSTLNTVTDTRSQVTELTLSLLVASLKVLLTTLLLQGLVNVSNDQT
jgi:hypothetical protein